MEIDRAIRVAESLLPGSGPILLESDPRWQALMAIRPFVQEEPEAVWDFLRRYGCYADPTLRHALASCLLQELLALHFGTHFQGVVRLVRESKAFADTFARCAKYGQSEQPGNAEAFDDLRSFAERFRRESGSGQR
ncbi:MAG: hypothetical protein IPJ19_02930 [Planctomycetes bacterium]|nr:hypothetical protein [Planctomycetota bacterium]